MSSDTGTTISSCHLHVPEGHASPPPPLWYLPHPPAVVTAKCAVPADTASCALAGANIVVLGIFRCHERPLRRTPRGHLIDATSRVACHYSVCQRVLSLRYNGRCPFVFFLHSLTLLPNARWPAARSQCPSVCDLSKAGVRLKTSVPQVSRDIWSWCHITAMASVVAHRAVRAWTDLLCLPTLVVLAPSRGGFLPIFGTIATTRRRIPLRRRDGRASEGMRGSHPGPTS